MAESINRAQRALLKADSLCLGTLVIWDVWLQLVSVSDHGRLEAGQKLAL